LRRLDGGVTEQLRAALAAEKLPTEDLSNTAAVFYAFEKNGEALGYAGLEGNGEVALLRSVVVMPAKRGAGLGRSLVERVLDEAASMGYRNIYLLTATASQFFLRLAFTPIDRAAVPAAVAASREFAELCPATAICMHRLLVGEGDLGRA